MNDLNQKLKDSASLENIFNNLKEQLNKIHRHARAGSFQTRARYYLAMLQFLKYLAVAFHLEKIANISGRHVQAYVEYRQEHKAGAATIKTDLSAIRYYMDQVPNAKYRIPSNDELAVELEKRHFGDVDRTWTEPEYEAFCALAHDKGKDDYGDLAVLAHDLGLRIHEAHRIDTASAREALKTGHLQVKGKGGKLRTVPLTPACKELFRRKLKETPSGSKLFVSNDLQTHLAIDKLQTFIFRNRESIRDKTNPVPLTFHGLRHTFATNTYNRLKAEGRSDFEAHIAVSRLLGHERADVTDIYLA